jgi:hypothetical protein
MPDSEMRQTQETQSLPTQPVSQPAQVVASEHVGEAHQLLTRLRQKVHEHPELDAAIERLELALAVLNVGTGGML